MATAISTDRGCQTAKAKPDGSRADHAISNSPGLRLRVTADGRKSWSLLYRRASDGARRRMALGEYPAMSLAEAKREAGRMRNEVLDGKDPADERKQARAAETFEALAMLWLNDHAKAKKRSWREDERMLRHDVLPAIGQMKAGSVTKMAVRELLRVVADRGAGYQANRVLSLVRSIYNWGVRNDLAERNPAAGIDKLTEEEKRARFLNADEIRRFWLGLDAAPMTPALRVAMRLSLFLGQRVNELAAARKEEFDPSAKTWLIPGKRLMPGDRRETGTKNKEGHLLPLTEKALALLSEALDLSGSSEWLFPSPRDAGAPIGEGAISRAWGRARDAMGLDDARVHDLRRTFATAAGDCGFDDFQIGLVTNHKSGRSPITGLVYNQAKYMRQKTAVLEAVERHLLSIIEGRESASNAAPPRRDGPTA